MNGTPRIESVKPAAALPGGEVSLKGSGFGVRNHRRPQVQFGSAEASLVLAAEDLLIARVPDGAAGGAVGVGDVAERAQTVVRALIRTSR